MSFVCRWYILHWSHCYYTSVSNQCYMIYKGSVVCDSENCSIWSSSIYQSIHNMRHLSLGVLLTIRLSYSLSLSIVMICINGDMEVKCTCVSSTYVVHYVIWYTKSSIHLTRLPMIQSMIGIEICPEKLQMKWICEFTYSVHPYRQVINNC